MQYSPLKDFLRLRADPPKARRPETAIHPHWQSQKNTRRFLDTATATLRLRHHRYVLTIVRVTLTLCYCGDSAIQTETEGMAKVFPAGNERLVLELLRDKPQGKYGLELVDASEGRLRRGSVYVVLGRMVEKGFVKSEVKQSAKAQPGLPRPIYEITALGQRALQAAVFMETGSMADLTLQEA